MAVDTSGPDRSFIPAGYLSEVEAESGRFFSAFEALERARVLEEGAGLKESYRIVGRLGYINAAVGDVEAAARQLSRAIEASEGEDQSYLCLFLRVRGDLRAQKGRRDEAFGDYSRALDVALNQRFKDYEGHVLRGLGDVYRLQKDLSRSAENYGAALTIASDTGYLWLEAEARIGLAHLAIETGDYEEAGRQANVALKIASSGGWSVQEIQAHIALAKISAFRGLMIEARSHAEIAGSLIEESGHYWSRKQLGAYEKYERGVGSG
jgi:tetratricopeptide (TPR) repeat protein